MKLEKKMMNKQNRWLDLAQELQFLAQGGLAYTKDSGYFSLDELPELAEEKVTLEQIKMCFKAHFDGNCLLIA